MKILLIHNRYQQPGGEDSVFQAENDLLSGYGHEIDQMVLDNSSIKTVFDRCLSGLKTLYNPDSARLLKTKIQSFHPDVIHVHNFFPLVSASIFFMAKRLGIPVVVTLHNYRLICPSATLFYQGRIYEKSIHSIFPFDAILKGVYRNSKVQTAAVALMTAVHRLLGTWKNKIDVYIVLTQFAKEKFEESTLAILVEKLVVKPNFVKDCGRGNTGRDDFFLFVGRLTEEKGIRTLLKAAKLYKFNLTIVGDGPLRNVVEDYASQCANICYPGFQDKSVVMNYMKKCKALIFPSIWYEGFPVTILEAFSAGTPVIASRLGSMKEIVSDRVNGLHFEPGNANDLGSKIIEMTTDKKLAGELSDQARQTYLNQYTPDRNYSQLMGIYRWVIDGKQPNQKMKLRTLKPVSV